MEPSMSSQLNNILLKVKERDSSAVYEVSFSYGMYQMSWEDLHQALLDKSSDGLIGKEGFARFFRELSDDDSSWSTAKADLERRVMGIFDCFDRTGSDYCDVDELTCGLSLFIRGSKSNKLLSAFQLLDEDGDGYLTRRGTWRFFRSFLSSLVAMSSAFMGNERPELNTLLDDVSVQVTSDVLGGNTSKVSFDLISDWYSTKGYIDSTWIELLDLKKWVSGEEGGGAAAGENFYDDEEEEEEDDDDDDDDEETEATGDSEYSERAMALLKSASDHAMSITVEDTNRVFSLSIASGLRTLEASQLEQAILPHASGDGHLSPAGFLNFLSSVMPESTQVSNEQRETVVQHLFGIYYAFEHSAMAQGTSSTSGRVDVFSLSAGLSLLCRGSKSSKLGVGFGLFCDEEKESLSFAAVAALMASYLLVLQALDVLPEGGMATDTAFHLARIMFESVDGPVNFISFGKWYNLEGCHCAPWIELLNLEKWLKITGTDGVPSEYLQDPITSPEESGDSAYPYQPLEDDDDDDEDDDDDDDEDDAVEAETFAIVFNSQSYERRINVNKATAHSVNSYTKALLNSIDEFGTMCGAIEEESESSLIRRDKFERLLWALSVPVDVPLHQQAEGASFIMTVFDYFDRGNTQEVDVCDLIIALATLLHTGSKSEKLAFAFDLLDSSSSGQLSRWHTWRFFRCFITTIVLMAAPQVEGKKEFVQILADESATWVANSVFYNAAKNAASAGREFDGSTITFDDIADWYSTTGCEDSSWIELLNITKWVALVKPSS